jgi:hypothetical protein
VAKIVEVEWVEEEINPPNLVVTAKGEVPTAGYTKPVLDRVSYVNPPQDGIQDYHLKATPPSGVAATVLSQVKATDRWKGYTQEAPWIKGIRVHGVCDGIVVKMFAAASAGKPGSHERTFEGTAKNGNVQDALDDALKQLDKALAEGGVADAQATWKISGVTGQRGGITGSRTAKVTITATRSPDWSQQ